MCAISTEHRLCLRHAARRKEDYREAQLASIGVDDAMHREVMGLYNRRSEIPLPQRLPLIDLVVPTLRQLSPDQYATFRENVHKLIAADQAVHLFEFALQKTLLRHLDLYFTRQTGASVKYRAIIPLLPSVQTLLSALAYIDHPDPAQRDAGLSVRRAAAHDQCRLVSHDAGGRLRPQPHRCRARRGGPMAAPQVKRTILAACREVVNTTEWSIPSNTNSCAPSRIPSTAMPPLPPVTE